MAIHNAEEANPFQKPSHMLYITVVPGSIVRRYTDCYEMLRNAGWDLLLAACLCFVTVSHSSHHLMSRYIFIHTNCFYQEVMHLWPEVFQGIQGLLHCSDGHVPGNSFSSPFSSSHC
jgi:hypothetical protein